MAVTRHKRRRYAAPIGGLFVGFATIGVLAVIFLSIRLTFSVLDNSPEKKMFGDIILPVVLFNPAPFEKATDIEEKNLLLYSMWATLMGEKNESYQIGDTGELVVPASDLDVAAARLFGLEVELVHQTFGELDMVYYYDEKNESYNVPGGTQLNVYTPQVDEITKNGDLYELHVGYVPSGVSWQTNFRGGFGTAAPEKYMNYFMQKSRDGYYIVKIQDPVNPNNVPPITSEADPGAEQPQGAGSTDISSSASGGDEPADDSSSDSSSESGEDEPTDNSEPAA